MNDKRPSTQSTGMSLGDIYYILFRQKWLIAFFSLAGILGALVLLLIIKPPQYLSEAKLSIRYVVEGKSLNPPGEEPHTIALDGRDAIIGTEEEILHSLDLAGQVVQVVTPERILYPNGKPADTNQAALFLRNNLVVESTPGTSMLRISFQHPDPKVPQEVLYAVLDAYFTKHVQMHQGVALFGGFLTNETTRLRSELARTEEELRNAKMKVGIISVDDAKKAYTEEMSKIRQDLLSAQTELAGRQAILKALTKDAAGNLEVTNTETTAMMPDDQVNAYKGICMRLDVLENKEQEFLTQQGFTEENVLVKDVHGQITELQKQKKALEDKNPKLASLRIPVSISNGKDSGTLIDLPTEYAEVAAVKSRIESLNSQSSQIWAEVTNFEKAEGTILELQQKRDLEQADLKYFAGTLEQNQINDALGVDKASNISIIQSPSTPIKAWSKAFKKKVAMVAVGGVVFGLALAFLMEMFIDRSVRRPSEIETKLRLPLFISIPNIGRNGHSQRLQSSVGKHLQLNDAASNGSALTISNASTGNVIPPWDRAHFLRPFYEGLRDRLIVHFEVRNLTHKPKMVAVTSCNKGAGVSSIAAGMAASLSETGDGNVLLVNMSGKQGAAQQFHKGDPSCDLDEALEVDTMKGALIGGNLYAATERADEKNPPSALPKRLRGLMPKLKASDYDYIIFDLPPVNQTSVTARLSGYMDMVLLVIESEKTNQDVVQRVNKLLEESKANVSTVLNKVRTYVPTQLHQEYLGDV